MADYQGLIRVGIQGFSDLDKLERKILKGIRLSQKLEKSLSSVGQINESALRNVQRAAAEVNKGMRDLRSANRARTSSAQRRNELGQYTQGGGTPQQRKLANELFESARLRTIAAKKGLAEEERNRRLVVAAEQRYARALGRATAVTEVTLGAAREQQARIDQTMRRIGQGSRGNYLTNLFQGRQLEFARGGAGAGLPAALQQQAQNVRAAWDVATAGGRENLQLMQRLATEMAGLVRQQNELNRSRGGRSIAYESGRRGQERITALSAMPGADPRKIRGLRSQATGVIAAGYTGDIPTFREAQRRMNVAIGRYERELNAAAKDLRAAQRRGGPSSPIRGAAFIEGSPAYMERLARMGGARESIRGRKDLVGSPAYIEEQQKQIARAIRAGGPKESIKGRKDLIGSPAYYEEQQRQLAKAIRAGGPRENIKGRKDLVGSPAYIEAQRKEQAQQLARAVRAGGPRESIAGRKDLVGSPAYYEEQRRQLDRAIRAGGPRESIKGRKDLPGSPAYIEAEQKRAEQAARLRQREQERQARADRQERNRIARLRQIASPIRGTATMVGSPAYFEAQERAQMAQQGARRLGPASPIRGTATMVGSPAYLAAQQRARPRGLMQGSLRQAVGEGLIGGAFPLLFGQGLGASAGGLAGGFSGGLMGGSFGFGLSLIGTAVGGAVDTTANNLKELAGSLKAPNDAMTALEKSGFNVSDSLKFQVKSLQDVGRAYDAQTLVLQEVEKRLGAGSVKELNALNGEQKKLQESWSILAGDIQRAVIPAIIGFTVVLNDLVSFINSIRKGREGVDTSKRNYRFNPFTGRLTDIGARERSQGRVEKIIAAAPSRVALKADEAYEAESRRIDLSRKAADDIRSAYREAFNLQRRAYDLQRDGADINREIADYGHKKEREIFELRQQAAEKQVENIRSAAQNRIEGSDLSARQTFAAAVGFEQQLLSNVREAMRARMEGESDIEQSRRRLELAMARLNRDSEDYKRTNAREIEDIERRKLSYIRSVEDYKKQIADYIYDRTIKAADYQRQAALTAGTPAGAPGAGGSGAGQMGPAVTPRTLMGVPGVIEYLTGDRSSPGYRADHGGSNYHEHIAFASRQIRDNVIAMLRKNGIVIGSTDGGRHAPNSYHYTGQAVDIPGSQVPVGQEDALARRVRSLIAGYLGGAAPAPQAGTAAQLSNIPAPVFRPTPIGPTPSAAPSNAANMAARSILGLSERDAQRIYEAQIKLRQKGIELGQIEQILQNNQLPQLQQQHEALKLQVEARRQILGLSDQGASLLDAEAEGTARVAQIEKDRANAIAGVQKQYGNNAAMLAQVNTQADLALNIAREEEKQRLTNIELNNRLQGMDRARGAILQMQEELAVAKAQSAALENGQLEASNVELMKASTLYKEAEEAQQRKLLGLAGETEELRKQNEFRRQMNELQRDTGLVGAGLRAGLIGTGARAFEQGMRDFNGDTSRATELAKQSQLLENQRLVWDNLEKSIVGVSDAISGALTNGLVDIANGSKKIEDVGRDMLNNIARSFADAAQQQLTALLQRQLAGALGGLLGGAPPAAAGGGILSSFLGAPSLIPGFAPSFTFGGFLAEGGNARKGEAYVVGEKEPEFFFPGVNGRVVPKSEMEKVNGLRRMNSEDATIDINYTVTEQAGVRYVTEEQFRKAQPIIAQRAQAMAYAGMRNSRDVRDYVGVD